MVISIPVESKDGCIWDPVGLLKVLIQHRKKSKVFIDLLNEGPCCKTVGLDELLDLMINDFGVDPDVYIIKTCNQIPSSRYREIRRSFVELNFVRKHGKKIPYIPSTLQKRFGIFISRSNWLRLSLASYLWNNHKQQTTLTYHFDHISQYHTSNFDLENAINRNWKDIEQIFSFVQVLPIKKDIYDYPILWNHGAFDMAWAYQDIFCDIVCETFFSGRTFMMTEKTMRAILFHRPFLIQGPQWYLKNLKSLGFKTFSNWWDEGYDEDPWDFKYQALKQNIDFIAQQSQNTISRWYQEMIPTLNHNREILLNLRDSAILTKDFFYE